jgi:hypothetical protein
LDTDEFAALEPATMPRSARYVAQVEWAWSPMHMRIDAYYISMDRLHRRWVLWNKPYDDNWGCWSEPHIMAAALRCSLDVEIAAKLLVLHAWSAGRETGLGRFHWVNEEGLLASGELNEIASIVWDDAVA